VLGVSVQDSPGVFTVGNFTGIRPVPCTLSLKPATRSTLPLHPKPKPETRIRKTRNLKPGSHKAKRETQNRHPPCVPRRPASREGCRAPAHLHGTLLTRNPQPETQNPEIRNPAPSALNSKQ
jgi:hypothetical protein